MKPTFLFSGRQSPLYLGTRYTRAKKAPSSPESSYRFTAGTSENAPWANICRFLGLKKRIQISCFFGLWNPTKSMFKPCEQRFKCRIDFGLDLYWFILRPLGGPRRSQTLKRVHRWVPGSVWGCLPECPGVPDGATGGVHLPWGNR